MTPVERGTVTLRPLPRPAAASQVVMRRLRWRLLTDGATIVLDSLAGDRGSHYVDPNEELYR